MIPRLIGKLVRSITDRFGGRRVPYVAQMENADCGAACLTMVLQYHGSGLRLDAVRESVGSGRDGVDVGKVLRGAERLGLRGRGLRLEVEDLAHLAPASILHWEFFHFVVFERVTRRGVVIVDPRYGRCLVPMERFRRAFTGVALELEPVTPLGAAADPRRPLRRYARMILEQRGLLARVVSLSVVLRTLALSLPVLTGLVVDRVVPRGDRPLVLSLAAGLGVMLAVLLLSSLVRAHLLLALRTRLDTTMTLGFLDHLLSLPYAFFQHRSTGDLMLRVAGNTAIRERLTTALLTSVLDGAMVVLSLALALSLSPPLGLAALAVGVLQVSVFVLARRRVRELMSQDLEAQARNQSYLAQLLAGIESVKVAGAERRSVQRWSNLFVEGLNVALARGRLEALTGTVRVFLQTGGPLLILTLGTLLVLDGRMTLGTMLAVQGMAAGFLAPLDMLVESALGLSTLGSYAERLEDVLAARPEQSGGTIAPTRMVGRIAVRKLSFGYSPGAPLVLNEVDLDIAPGALVALVGRSGSGKSSLAKLLLGLHHPGRGRILYDGRDLADLDLTALRRQMGSVPQHPYIFAGTLAENIGLAEPSATRERVMEAARLACIHDDIQAMSLAYDTPVSDAGVTLSGGQRQRLALARALLANPAILVLDEATSSLDAATERAVMTNLAQLACTRVVIAHRLSTIAAADSIVVLDAGRVVETGTHRDLLARGGRYHDLVAGQTRLTREEGLARSQG